MRNSYVTSAITVLLVAAASVCNGASSFNSSKSNVYRAVYSPIVSQAQAAAILADLDRMGKGVDQAAVLSVLGKHGVRTGCGNGCINHVKVVGGTRILLLENPGDEAQAIAVSDPGMPADKPTKGKATK